MTEEKCPGAAVLAEYAVGRLGEAESDAVAAHLERCPVCQAELDTVHDADDTLVRRLREPVPEEPYLDESHCNVALARAKALAGRSEAGEASAGDDPSALGGTLGEYRLLKRLGHGGMGTVYQALHTKLDRVVALKVLPKGRLEDRQAVARFEREMKAAARLDHPNIVKAYDAREIDDMPVLVMEYVEGMDLGELARRVGRLPLTDACELARQAALALEHVHEHGLVHRDVKPSNLMLTRQGELKLLDVGLARFYLQSPGGEVTDTGQAMGTADYMAPEQVSSSREVDIRADVYSLGCTLTKLLSGRAPFGGPKYPGNFEKMTAHVETPAPPIRELVPEVPERLAALIDRMLAKSPDDRPGTPAEVAERLAPFCEGHDLGTLVQRAEQREPAGQAVASQAQPADAVPCPAPSTEARRSVWLPVAIGLMAFSFVLGFALGFPLGIVIRIERDGKTTELTVPDGSRVEIGDEGRVDVKLPGPGEQAETPRVTAVAQLAALRGWWEVVSVEKGEAADLFLEGPDSVGRFDPADVDRALIKDQIHWYDLDQGAYYPINYAVDPVPSPGTIDLLTPSGTSQPEETIARGVYALEGGTLRICAARYLPSLVAEQRPEGFRVEPRSGDVLFTLRRYEFTADEKALQDGTWRLVSAVVDGRELPADELAGAPSLYGGQSSGDRRAALSLVGYHFSANAKFLMESLGGAGMGTSLLHGLCVLDPSQHPKAITLYCFSGYPSRKKAPRGIYELSGDRLRIAWRLDGPPPEEFQSEPGSGVTLIELERERPEAPAEERERDLSATPDANRTPPRNQLKTLPPNLSVDVSAPASGVVGEMVVFTVTVSNTGGPARDAEIAIQFDPQLVGTRTAGPGPRKASRWPLGTLPAGAKLQIQFPARCTAEAPRACAKVTATAEGAAEVADEAYVRIVAAPKPDEDEPTALPAPGVSPDPPVLSAEASAPRFVRRGHLAEFGFRVSNDGKGPARNVEVAVRFDPQLVPLDATREFQRKEGAIVWTLDVLPAGASRNFTVECEWTPKGDLVCARLTATAEGGAKATDEACLRIVADPDAPAGSKSQCLEAAAIQGKPAPAHPDHETIQGVWQAVAVTFKGEELPKEALEEMQIVLAQGRYHSPHPGMEGGVSYRWYALDPTRAPKWIDLELGEEQGSVFGVYHLEQDRLRLCYNVPGSARPTGFLSEKEPPNDGVLVECRRIGDAEAATKRLEAVEAAQAPKQESVEGDLKRIGLAMHTYHDRWKHFPPPVLHSTFGLAPTGAGAGAPPAREPYSWRVALLPILGHEDLYEQYRFDEPWDSPANKKVLDQMPDVYRHPSAPPDSTNTSYFVLTGPGTIFDDEEGRRFADIPDGTSNTVLVVEAKRDVPWTKPEDIPFDPEKPLPKLGGFTEGGFHALLADVTVRFIPESMDENMRRAAIQRADGQVVVWPAARE